MKKPENISFSGMVTFIAVLICAGLLAGIMIGAITGPLSPWFKEKYKESWSTSNLEKTRQRGEAIIQAIEAYHTAEGMLPVALHPLVPKYIQKIEHPFVGNKQWSFGRLQSYPEEYYLSVESEYLNKRKFSGPEIYGYNSYDKKWSLSEYNAFD